MRELAIPDPIFALLIDGTQAQIREVDPADREAARRLHTGMSPESLYLRFFSLSRGIGGEVADRICREPGAAHAAVGAWVGGELVGVASYEVIGDDGVAEVGLVVADTMHERGVGTLLLEHLASLARARGLRAFYADTLAQNHAVQRLFADAGLPLRRHSEGGVVEFTMPLTADARYLNAVGERERQADVKSLEHLLQPTSIAVIGAGRRPESIGAIILRNLLSSGYTGPVYAVNPKAGTELGGVPCFESAAGLPEPVDLAVLTVLADAVGQVARECGRRGVRSLVVVTSGVDGRELLATCHRYGMRLVGPNCFGITNTAAGFDATFSASLHQAGGAGVVVQSGGVGIALREHLSRLGIGLSTFASVGDKVRRQQQRHAPVVGVRSLDAAGAAVRRIVRQPAQVRAYGPPRRPPYIAAHGHLGTVGGRTSRRRLAHRGRREPGLGIGLTRHCRRTHPRPSHRPGRSAPGIHQLEARRAHSRTRDRPR